MQVLETTIDDREAQPTVAVADLPAMTDEPAATIDMGATRCPLLGLKTARALGRIESGETLEVTTDGPQAASGIKRVAWFTGAKLLATYTAEGRQRFLLRKA